MANTQHSQQETTSPKVVQGELVLPGRDINGVYSSAHVSQEMRDKIDRVFDDLRVSKSPKDNSPVSPVVADAAITVEGKVLRTIKSTEGNTDSK